MPSEEKITSFDVFYNKANEILSQSPTESKTAKNIRDEIKTLARNLDEFALSVTVNETLRICRDEALDDEQAIKKLKEWIEKMMQNRAKVNARASLIVSGSKPPQNTTMDLSAAATGEQKGAVDSATTPPTTSGTATSTAPVPPSAPPAPRPLKPDEARELKGRSDESGFSYSSITRQAHQAIISAARSKDGDEKVAAVSAIGEVDEMFRDEVSLFIGNKATDGNKLNGTTGGLETSITNVSKDVVNCGVKNYPNSYGVFKKNGSTLISNNIGSNTASCNYKNLTSENKKDSAIEFAKVLLAKRKNPDDAITLSASNPAKVDKEFAGMVHAALLQMDPSAKINNQCFSEKDRKDIESRRKEIVMPPINKDEEEADWKKVYESRYPGQPVKEPTDNELQDFRNKVRDACLYARKYLGGGPEGPTVKALEKSRGELRNVILKSPTNAAPTIDSDKKVNTSVPKPT